MARFSFGLFLLRENQKMGKLFFLVREAIMVLGVKCVLARSGQKNPLIRRTVLVDGRLKESR